MTKEVPVRPPDNPEQPEVMPPLATLGVLGLAALLRAELDDELAPVELTMRRYSTLGHIAASPGISYSELARRAAVTAQTMHVLARTMETEGLLTQRGRAGGRGSPIGLVLTVAGDEALRQGRLATQRVDRRVFAALSKTERAALTSVLARLVPWPALPRPEPSRADDGTSGPSS